MTYNLVVAYDLNREMDSSGYQAIENAIGSLGEAIRIQESVWFVSSLRSPRDAAGFLHRFIDENDYLAVFEAADGAWYGLMPGASDFLKNHWAERSL